MLSAGIVGLPNVGKSTLFNAVTKTQKAQAANATLEEYALTAGCIAIARTEPGEKYQAPDGSWKTRTSAPPERDSRCPG